MSEKRSETDDAGVLRDSFNDPKVVFIGMLGLIAGFLTFGKGIFGQSDILFRFSLVVIGAVLIFIGLTLAVGGEIDGV